MVMKEKVNRHVSQSFKKQIIWRTTLTDQLSRYLSASGFESLQFVFVFRCITSDDLLWIGGSKIQHKPIRTHDFRAHALIVQAHFLIQRWKEDATFYDDDLFDDPWVRWAVQKKEARDSVRPANPQGHIRSRTLAWFLLSQFLCCLL